MQILNDQQVRQKIRRIAIEIVERNFGEPELVLAGLNNNGLGFARLLMHDLTAFLPENMQITITRIRLNPANPIEYAPYIEMDTASLQGKNIILIDDVANTGRTIFYAMQPLLGAVPKKVEVAVLVDRKHKSFPIKADYVGLSLYTTLRDNIKVSLPETGEMEVRLT
jgi:pyrimidine operon attenuation protein / uracil phosphoribosyltransferase